MPSENQYQQREQRGARVCAAIRRHRTAVVAYNALADSIRSGRTDAKKAADMLGRLQEEWNHSEDELLKAMRAQWMTPRHQRLALLVDGVAERINAA